ETQADCSLGWNREPAIIPVHVRDRFGGSSECMWTAYLFCWPLLFLRLAIAISLVGHCYFFGWPFLSLWLATLTCMSIQEAPLVFSYIETTSLIQLVVLTQVKWVTPSFYKTMIVQSSIGRELHTWRDYCAYGMASTFSGLQPS
ncbi:hypothetical protein AVEN_127086-1, partial [Araneus ventricosus]